MDKAQQDMMNLWKKVFGDSDDYINLVFNSRNMNHIKLFYKYEDDIFVSGMLGVDYFLKDNSNTPKNINNSLKASYLCGLATLPEYRNKGIMSKLIERCNETLFNKGYVISFLIPAEEHLRYYYNKFGYNNITFVNTDNYTSKHSFIENIIIDNITDSNNKYYRVCVGDNNYNLYLINEILSYERNIINNYYNMFSELKTIISDIVIKYSLDDFITIIRDNNISNGKILLLTDVDNKPLGILFCSNIEDDKVTIQLLLTVSEEYDKILLQCLKDFLHREVSFEVRRYNLRSSLSYQPKTSEAIYSPYYVADSNLYPEGQIIEKDAVSTRVSRQKPFAMAKILNVAEILKFIVASYPDSEFSIFIKNDEFPQNEGFYQVTNKRLCFVPLSMMSPSQIEMVERECNEKLNYYNLSVPELASIIWRKGGTDNEVDNVIAIPKLPLNIALLLE